MLELRLLAFLRFSSSYVLGLSDYRDTALHRFCSLGPLPSTSGTRFCTVREKSWYIYGSRLTLTGPAAWPQMLCAVLGRNALVLVRRAARTRWHTRSVLPFQRHLFHSQEKLHYFSLGFFFFWIGVTVINWTWCSEMKFWEILCNIFWVHWTTLLCLMAQNTKKW